MNKQEGAYDVLRARIESGIYPPGQRLVIDQLASELKISQVPIREAVRRLEAECLIEYAANTGATVARFDPERWAQLLESVAVLEGYATALGAPFVTAADLKLMRRCNHSIRLALPTLDLPAISRANRQFHAIILGRCPNRVILEELQRSQSRLDSLSRTMFARDQAVLVQFLGPATALKAVADHEELMAALRTGESALRIEQLTREHVLVHLRAVRARLEAI
jgi:DNA-binding GntR family transcriptional regulator